MFESKLAVIINPQMLNKFEESKTTVEMVEKAIEKGYVIDGRTPDFLFKYEAIIDLLIRTHNNLDIFSAHLDTLMSCETRRKELTIFYADRFTSLGRKLDASYFVDYMEPDPKYADFIQRILGVSYLKKNPDYVYSKEFDLENYFASDELFDFLDEINVDFSKLHRGVEYDIELYIKRFPRILKAPAFSDSLRSYDARSVIREMVEEGKLTYDDFPEYLLDDELMIKLIIKDPSLLDKFPEYAKKYKESYGDNACIVEFIENLPKSLVNMEALSFAFGNIRSDYEGKVKQAIMESGFLINSCNWYFITNDAELIMDQIRKNPNILNTCPGLMQYSVTEEMYKEIMDIVEKSGITLYTIQSFYYNNGEFLDFLLKNNPSIFYNIAKNNTNSAIHYLGERANVDLDGPITPSAPPYGKAYDAGIVDAIRMNPHNYYSLLGCYNKKEYSLEAYEALLQSGINLYEHFDRPTYPDFLYERIEEIRNMPEGPGSMCFDTYNRDLPVYPLYYVANYPDLVEIKRPSDTFVFDFGSNSSATALEVEQLKPDFSNYTKLKDNLSEDELLRINDMYWANKKNIILESKFLAKNPYIYINELLINNMELDRSTVELNDVQIEYYNKRFKELNCKLNRFNYIYVRDFDLLLDALNNGLNLRYLNTDWMSEEQLNKWYDVIREQIVSGKISLDNVSVEFAIEYYDLMKEYFDSAALMKHLHYFVNGGQHEDIFLDLIENNSASVNLSDLDYLDDDVIRKLFEKNKSLLSLAKRRYDKLDFRIQDILDEIEYEEVDINVKGEVTKDFLDKIVLYNPTNIGLLTYYKSCNIISLEVYLEYYKKCLENIKSGCEVNDIEFDANIDLPIDKDLVEYLMNYDREICVQYLCSYYAKEHDYVFNYINDNYDKLKHVTSSIIKTLSLEDLDILIGNNKDLLDEKSFWNIFAKHNKNPGNFKKVYDYWCLAGKPLLSLSFLNNNYIAQDVLSNDEHSFTRFDIYSSELSSPISINMVYNYYKSKGNIDITSSPLFYMNPLILLDYAGKEIPVPPPLDLDTSEKAEIYLMIARDYPSFSSKLSELSNYFIKKFIEKEPIKAMNYLPYENHYKSAIIEALKGISYHFDENTPSVYLANCDVLLNMLEENNDRIDFVINVIENNMLYMNKELKDYISKVVVEKGLSKYAKFVGYYDLKDFLIECIDKDFNSINDFKNIKMDMNVVKHIFEIALEKIKSGEYVIDENTPEFLFYNDEIRAIVREKNPRLLDNFGLERLDRARDHSLIENAIKQPDKVDELFKGVARNYPIDLVNELVDKLISMDYKVSENTPRFIMCNYKFMYHLLKNNVSVDDKYIHNFVTFENYHILKDTELFTDLINKGYGYEFKNFILKFGLETTLQLASQYGYLLNLVDLSKVRILDDIPVLLASDNPALDVFDRVEDFENLISRCNALNISSYSYERALMRKYLKDVDANKDKIVALIKNDFYIHNDNGIGKYFFNDIKLLDLYITYTPEASRVRYVINSCKEEIMTEEVLMNAIKRGYILDEYTPEYIRTNHVYVYEIISRASYGEVTKMIDSHKDVALNQAIINRLIELRYELSSRSPDIILRNLEFLVPYFDRCNYSKDYREGMKLVDASIYKELLYAIDIRKMTLYFKDIVPEDKFELFALNFAETAESKRDVLIKMLTDGKKLNDSIKTSYEKYILEHIADIKYEDMDKVIDCLIRISQSNSGEIRQFASTLVEEVLKFENYEAAFKKVEDIFLQDHLPMVTKLFLVFKVLHKDYSRFNGEHLSPVLKNATNAEKDDIIYKDLLRAAFRSNNRSLLEYLHDLSDACDTLEQYENDKENVNIDKLNKALMFLLAIVNSSYVKNHDSSEVKLTNDYDSLITMLKEQFKGYGNLKDAIVQNLFDFPTYDDAVRYIHEYAMETDRRNRERVKEGFCVEPGDYIKGIGSANYLTNILQNGSVSKEFLGDSAGSDATPLDTDLSRIKVETGSIGEAIGSTAASGYGDIYFILKDGSRFAVTRTKDGGDALEQADGDKLESFYTAVCDNVHSDHYGIRTGFASSEIDYIVSTDKRVQLEVALNGFYIPIVDKQGNLVFTPEDYDKLRSKMSGIEYYGSGPYQMASYEDLLAPGVEEMAAGVSENRVIIRVKHNAIKTAVSKGMKEVNIVMKDKLDGNVMAGYADLIDTGSTARGTDLPGKADFDYICRVDRSLYNNPTKFEEFKEAIKRQFISIDKEEYVNGNFRFKGVMVEGLDEKVDIDLSFVIRTNKLTISSDESLLTRMNAIESGNYSIEGDREITDPKEARDLVTGNILMAKKLLKAYKCYKKHSSPEKEGGLGGIGIENWILQNGGSLKRAAESFMEVASRCNSYEEFKVQYAIWDFGQNHYALEGSDYSHDEFVYKNMDAAGYERMKAALKCYLEYGEKALDEAVAASIVSEVNDRVLGGTGKSL